MGTGPCGSVTPLGTRVAGRTAHWHCWHRWQLSLPTTRFPRSILSVGFQVRMRMRTSQHKADRPSPAAASLDAAGLALALALQASSKHLYACTKGCLMPVQPPFRASACAARTL